LIEEFDLMFCRDRSVDADIPQPEGWGYY